MFDKKRSYRLRKRRRVKHNFSVIQTATCVGLILATSCGTWFGLFQWSRPPLLKERRHEIYGENELGQVQKFRNRHSKPHEDKRIAILIPFLSSDAEIFPPYASIFLRTVQGSASLVDFFIFHNGELTPLMDEEKSTIADVPFPSNVKFIDLGSMTNFVSYFLRVVDARPRKELSLDKIKKLHTYLAELFTKYPYFLVEYKVEFYMYFSFPLVLVLEMTF